MSKETTTRPRCGFVNVIGLPNAGKSTLVNALVGAKVSIVSRKVQTTRCRVLGIALKDNAQIILIDTPGLFAPRKTLEKAMVDAALSSFEDADIIIHIADAGIKDPITANKAVFKALSQHKHTHQKVVLVLNKIDCLNKQHLLSVTQTMNTAFPYDATFMISALKDQGVSDIADYLANTLPENIWLYPEDQTTDMPVRLMAAEITREQIYNRIHQEIPYAAFVETEKWEEHENGSVSVSQVIYVKKEGHKGILLGKGGSTLKAIGTAARKEMEEMLERRVHLKTFVRVQPNWTERAEHYDMFGLNFPGQ